MGLNRATCRPHAWHNNTIRSSLGSNNTHIGSDRWQRLWTMIGSSWVCSCPSELQMVHPPLTNALNCSRLSGTGSSSSTIGGGIRTLAARHISRMASLTSSIVYSKSMCCLILCWSCPSINSSITRTRVSAGITRTTVGLSIVPAIIALHPGACYPFAKMATTAPTAPRQIPVEYCPLADQEHRASPRQYAHAFHRKGVICIAHATKELPRPYLEAIILHEVGHLLAGPRAGEDAANRAARAYSGVTIYYRDSPYGEQLEWIKPEDRTKARAALGI